MSIFQDFFSKTSYLEIHKNQFQPAQLGAHVQTTTELQDNIDDHDIIIIGIGEQRGAGKVATSTAPDDIRAALYKLYHWHPSIKICDAGNLILGNNIYDSYQALVTTLYELNAAGKKVIILGGSHDLTFAQYKAFAKANKLVEGVIIDSKINIDDQEGISDSSFLYKIISDANNYLKHLTILGFQSYLTNPNHLQTLDSLRFDLYRLGHVREQISRYEADFRNADFVSVDVEVLKHAEMPWHKGLSPNGLQSDELCQLMKFAGESPQLSTLGIYGYDNNADIEKTGADSIAQMIWYYINGVYLSAPIPDFDDHQRVETHHVHADDHDLTFKKCIKTGKFWMQLKDKTWMPAAVEDFMDASMNHIPERWLRANERIV